MISAAFQYIFGKEKKHTLLLGLIGAGKTTILHELKLAKISSSESSNGFKVEKLKSSTIVLVSWDIENQDKQHILWQNYYPNTENIIFVIDSSDHEHIDQSRQELQNLLSQIEFKDAHLLIYANKKDLPNTMNIDEITDKLDLHSLDNRQWYVQAVCAKTGDGLFEGLDWLSKQSKTIE